ALDNPCPIVPPAGARYQVLLCSGLALPNVPVRIYTTQRAELVVNQTEGNTSVAQDLNGTVAGRVARGADDTLSLRLSKSPQAGETVTVNLGGSGQLRFFDGSYNPITSLTFDASHPWNVAQTVYVEA